MTGRSRAPSPMPVRTRVGSSTRRGRRGHGLPGDRLVGDVEGAHR